MRKARVYVDTSVFGGTQDEEFEEASKSFFERVKAGEYTILISPVTAGELEEAPDSVRQVLRDVPREAIEDIAVDQEVQALAHAYVSDGGLPEAAAGDALHVAAATVAEANLILSWNFRHIVNYDRIQRFNAVNLMNGYRTLDIRSPLEMGYGD